MRLSFVIPAFNEERLLPSTLSALHAATASLDPGRWDHEIIVCDNNSSDRTATVAGEHGARVVFEPVNMIARARNAGAAAAAGDWIIFVDADSKVSPGLVSSTTNAIASGRFFAGGATVRLDAAPRSAHAMCGAWNLVSRSLRWPAGSYIFVDAAVFRDIGGFSSKHYAGEEIDLARRLKKSALARGRRLTILHRHPLLTSSRKLHLYTPREIFSFLLRVSFRPGKTLSNRESCAFWYDGRR